MVRTASQSARM